MAGDAWIFGYGSLVWRPDFPFAERAVGHIQGFCRRFWQGSPDHRGTHEAPGRVVTLVPEAGARCGGVAFRVLVADRDAVLATLDERESGGFERIAVDFQFAESARSAAGALVYVAAHGNPNFLGHAPTPAIASQIRACAGKSGTNTDYALRLADSLRALGLHDDHVFEIAELVR